MKASKDFVVRLIGPQFWRSLVNESFRTLAAQERRFAESVLFAMHNRHIGITPNLVAELVPVLLSPGAQVNMKGAWTAVFERLADELSAGKTAGSKNRRFGFLLHSDPIYVVFRLAIPVAEEACRQTGFCFLFCEDETEVSIKPGGYDKYSKGLYGKVRQIAQNKDDEFELFWKSRAAALSSFSSRAPSFGRKHSQLPEEEPDALAHLFRLDPDIPFYESPSSRSKKMNPQITRRRIFRQKQGGIDGIHLTRDPDDIGDILLSEYLNHELILADRIVNTGFFAIQREPKREKPKDVFITGLMPEAAGQSQAAAFIKACWFECLMRLGLILRRHRMLESEFRWIEEDRFENTRACVFLLENMPYYENIEDGGPDRAFRREFMAALRWLPDYFDSRFNFVSDKTSGSFSHTGNETKIDRMIKWAFWAWKNQKNIDEFAHMHIMLFLPAGQKESNAMRVRLSNGFGLGKGKGRHLSVTRIPDIIDDLESWSFETSDRAASNLFPGGRKNMEIRKIAGRLVLNWLEQLSKEIWGG